MSLDGNVVAVVQAIGAEIKNVRTEIAQGGGGGTQNVFIQETEPTVNSGSSALWMQTNTDGSVTFNLVIGD